ncbi:conjugative transposon protein TraJ [Galbibacter sp. EGI 63066]|uniref:conjugative transposon protein TraJ n=1 Tax=Galbibacter sp. EGI 63066 TaxID=2993559 RepID=UPI0022493044|nr:conjugative transposon protein TraJ [Galbibacter sp. EGI 63066]MCX2680991.1 conjugative transposon protein TraJ [Galbibacter sp. EGI 63066]
MKKRYLMIVVTLLPLAGMAQGTGVESLHGVLQELFDDMIPLSNRLIGAARALAGFAALWYIALRVWRHIANAEPIDMYPLLRPFAIGMAILLYPYLIALLNGVLSPVVKGTQDMVKNPNQAVTWHIEQGKREIVRKSIYPWMGDAEKFGEYGDTAQEQPLSGSFWFLSFKSGVKQVLRWVLEMIYLAAALCIDTLRTFQLIVLVILGPIVLGLSVFDGFQHTLTGWISRYINVFMWLPIANIFGAITARIQENMYLRDPGFFGSSVYIIFMIIAIVGYFKVPTIANYIIQSGQNSSLLQKAGKLMVKTAASAAKIVM